MPRKQDYFMQLKEPVGTIALVVGILISLATQEGRDFFYELPVFLWKCFSEGFTRPFPALALIIVAATLFGIWLSLRPREEPRRPIRVGAALREAAERHRVHLRKVVTPAIQSNDPICAQLAVAVLDTYSAESESLVELQKLNPLMPANFNIYAQCVCRVFDDLMKSPDVKFAEIYTLLKRPLVDWYNPLRTCAVPGVHSSHGAFTRIWWENYKKRVASLNASSNKNIAMFRLVLQKHGRSEMQPSREFGVNDSPALNGAELPVADAASAATPFCLVFKQHPRQHFVPYCQSDVGSPKDKAELAERYGMTLIASVTEMALAHSWPDGAHLHLIGSRVSEKLATTTPTTSQMPCKKCTACTKGPCTELTDHFENAYHRERVSETRGGASSRRGAFYGYVKHLVDEFRHDANYYDDIFALKLEVDGATQKYFGLAFVDDEDGDNMGMRFLGPGEVQTVITAFQSQWTNVNATVDDYCHCENL